MRKAVRVAGLIVVLSVGACRGPSDPGDLPGPDVVHLSIQGQATIRVGASIQYTATATRGDGSEEPARPVWTSSNHAVATISADGVLTGLSHGSTTITASQQTVSATKTVPVVNSYTGSWSGTYQIRVCDQSGSLAAARWCQSLGGVGAVLPATLVIEQPSSADFSRARGTLALGSIQGPPIPGVVTESGHLSLGGSFNVTANGVMARMTIGGWDTALDGRTVMVGRWAQSLAATAAAGSAYMENEIVTMNRTGPVPGAGVDSAPPTPSTLGWDDFISPLR